jgi:hypothetical protein
LLDLAALTIKEALILLCCLQPNAMQQGLSEGQGYGAPIMLYSAVSRPEHL